MTDLEVREQIRIIRRAAEDPDLIALVSPVVAAEFAVVPIERSGNLLRVATTPSGFAGRYDILTDVLGYPVEIVEFRDDVIRAYVLRLYLDGGSRPVNFNTFMDEGFLGNPENAEILAREKIDEVGRTGCDVAEQDLVFVEATLRGDLETLDGPAQGGRFEASDPLHPFRIHQGAVSVFREHQLSESVQVMLKLSYGYWGMEVDHGIRSEELELDDFPCLLHPTEIQMSHVGADGTCTFYVYDKFVSVRPGESVEETCTYYFLSGGRRMKRTLDLHVQRIVKLPRTAISIRPPEEDVWSPEDLKNWLGFN